MTNAANIKTRFAPSPTGRMHAGNVFASMVAWLAAKKRGGSVVLRIDDLDRDRSRTDYIDQVMRDYEALGLTWDEGPFYQRDNDAVYEEAFQRICGQGNVYPCYCTRADLKALASAPHLGEGSVYPGTCRSLTEEQRAQKALVKEPSWRLEVPDRDISLEDLFQGSYTQNIARECGDFIVRRSDGAFAYQLACVLDDAAEGINLVVRGIDLLPSSPRQMLLQRFLGLPKLTYGHVPLLCADDGRRLSKRNKDASIDCLMKTYGTPEGVLGHIAFITGMTDADEPATMDELLVSYDEVKLRGLWEGKISLLWR